MGPLHPTNEEGIRRVFALRVGNGVHVPSLEMKNYGIVHWQPWMRDLFILVLVLAHAGTKF